MIYVVHILNSIGKLPVTVTLKRGRREGRVESVVGYLRLTLEGHVEKIKG